jgi:hypothetical protein
VLLLFVVEDVVGLVEDDGVEAAMSGCSSDECDCCCACACALIFVSLDDVLGDDDDDDDAMT